MLLGTPVVPLPGLGRTLVGDIVSGSFVAEHVVGIVPHLAATGLLALEHEGGEAGGIRLECEIEQVIHASRVFLGIFVGDLELQPLRVDLRQRLVSPLARPLNPFFQSTDGVEILLHFPLVFFSQATLESLRVCHHQIEHTRLAFEIGTDLLDILAGVGLE